MLAAGLALSAIGSAARSRHWPPVCRAAIAGNLPLNLEPHSGKITTLPRTHQPR
jgi:hypothetical protein